MAAIPGALMPFVTLQFLKLDDDGVLVPNAGGFVEFRATDLVTLQNTYTSSALTTPNDNPIELDADGRPPNPIFLLNTALYSVFVYDEDNNPADVGSTPLSSINGIGNPAEITLNTLGVVQSTGTVTSSSPYTLQSTDNAIYIEFASSGTVQLLSAALYKRPLLIVNRTASTQSVTPASGQTINAGAADVSFTMAAGSWPNYPALLLISDGVSDWTVQSYSNVP